MALLCIEGFGHFAAGDITKKWPGTALTTGTSSIVVGRRSGSFAFTQSVSSNALYFSKTIANSGGSFTFGVAVRLNTNPSASNRTILTVFGVSLTQLSGTSTISVGGCGISATISSTLGAWTYIEVKATVGTSLPIGTSSEVRVNGATHAVNSATYTLAANTTVGFGAVAVQGGSANTSVSDFYICDNSGSSNNSFLGDVRVDTIFPVSDGNYSEFTPSTAGAHWSLVDDATPNTTDYVDGTAVNQTDSFGLQDISTLSSSSVYGVQVNVAIAKDDAGARSAASMIRTDGTDAVGAGVAIGTTQAYLSQIYATDAGGSAWTQSSVNAMEAGIKVTV